MCVKFGSSTTKAVGLLLFEELMFSDFVVFLSFYSQCHCGHLQMNDYYATDYLSLLAFNKKKLVFSLFKKEKECCK